MKSFENRIARIKFWCFRNVPFYPLFISRGTRELADITWQMNLDRSNGDPESVESKLRFAFQNKAFDDDYQSMYICSIALSRHAGKRR